MLVGRARERSRIGALLSDAAAGSGAVLVLTGEAGIGKSALVRDACERAEGLSVLRATGVESEAELPFSGLHELLHPLLGLVGELPPPQAAAMRGAMAVTDEPVDRFCVFAAALSLLAAAAAEQPVLAVVDDAQWIDSISLEALGFAARRLGSDPVGILVAAREEPAGFPESRFERLRLAPLAVDDVAGLVVGVLERSLSESLVGRVAEASRGNPLAALEVAAAARDDRLAARIALGEPVPVRRLITESFAGRIDRLSAPAQLALLVCAAGEADATHVVIDAARRLGVEPSAFAEAEHAEVIMGDEDHLRFRHPLLRSTVYGRATTDDRRRAHGALADSLEGAAGTALPRRAWHLAAATVAPDERVAAELASAAARFAERSGNLAAAYAYERSAQLTPARTRRAERLVAAAEAARLAGRAERARELLVSADELTGDPALRADIAFKHAMLDAWTGSIERAGVRYAALADSVMETDPNRGALALAHAAGAAVAAGDTGAALAPARRAGELLDQGGLADRTASSVREALGTVLVLRGMPNEGGPLLREAAGWFERHDEGRDYVAQALLWTEDYELAYRCLRPLADRARRTGDLRALSSALEIEAQLDFRVGDWRAAHAAAEESARLAADSGQVVQLAFSLGVLALIEAGKGDPASGEHARRADEIAAASGLAVIAEYTGAARGLDALGDGRPADALAELVAVEQHVAHTGRGQPGVLQWEADLLEAAARCDDHPAERLDSLAERARRTGHSWAAAVRARVAGMLADDYALLFADALAGAERAAAPFEAARTRLCWGQRLRRDGLRVHAREQLHLGLEGFERLGARPWADAALRELAATGERPRRRAAGADEELTPQELQIAQLVGAGASNKEVGAQLFLSPKTVETHLTRIYRKLGVSSRTQLALRLDDL
jgi:DNA-binding CsgD family transcriptional regulator